MTQPTVKDLNPIVSRVDGKLRDARAEIALAAAKIEKRGPKSALAKLEMAESFLMAANQQLDYIRLMPTRQRLEALEGQLHNARDSIVELIKYTEHDACSRHRLLSMANETWGFISTSRDNVRGMLHND